MGNVPRKAHGGLAEGREPEAAVFARRACGNPAKERPGVQVITATYGPARGEDFRVVPKIVAIVRAMEAAFAGAVTALRRRCDF